jgi:hypothetical protein
MWKHFESELRCYTKLYSSFREMNMLNKTIDNEPVCVCYEF